MSALKRRLAQEDGIAMVIAMATVAICLALGAAVFAASGQLTTSSAKDTNKKRALQAAQAGLTVAMQRLTLISANPSSSFADNCVTDREVAWSYTTRCPAQTGQLGNGASYTYYVTPSLDSTQTGISELRASCALAPAGSGERCVSAIGSVAGVTRRVQVRILAPPLFDIYGLVGLKKVNVDSSDTWGGSNFAVSADTGSNGQISFGQNINAPGSPYHCYLGPVATATGCSTPVRLAQPITVPSVDTLPFGAANQNSYLGAIPGWNSTTRTLALPAGYALSLSAGDYNLCSLSMGNGSSLSAAQNARVRIFIDSPARSGSGCSSGGTFTANSTTAKLNAATNVGSLEFYVYGTSVPTPPGTAPPPTTCGSDVNFTNGATVASSSVFIYAPNSKVVLESGAAMSGGVTGCEVTFIADNPSASYSHPPGNLVPTAPLASESGSWRECHEPTPLSYGVTDPYSQCWG
jgi:Tfp pilus assembly protein PilX